jgi:hypothetical protein
MASTLQDGSLLVFTVRVDLNYTTFLSRAFCGNGGNFGKTHGRRLRPKCLSRSSAPRDESSAVLVR